MQNVLYLIQYMMPWEHIAVAYVTYSLVRHVTSRAPPTSWEAFTIGLASLLPDLIDKPLAWGLGVFSSGYAVGHSIFFAVLLSLVVYRVTLARSRERAGQAFALAYPLHLIADVVPSSLLSGTLLIQRILWPVRGGGEGYEAGFVGEFNSNIIAYADWLRRNIVTGNPDPYLLAILGLGAFGVWLWVYDGMPLAREVYDTIRWVCRSVMCVMS